MSGPSIFPLRELMLICNGCGGERQVPEDVLARILSVDDFKAFAEGEILRWACRCGAKTCDIRMLPAEGAVLK